MGLGVRGRVRARVRARAAVRVRARDKVRVRVMVRVSHAARRRVQTFALLLCTRRWQAAR